MPLSRWLKVGVLIVAVSIYFCENVPEIEFFFRLFTCLFVKLYFRVFVMFYMYLVFVLFRHVCISFSQIIKRLKPLTLHLI